jgi:stage II sporulation protein P
MKKARRNFRFYHIHIVDFLRSLGIGILLISLLLIAARGITRYFAPSEDNDLLDPLMSFLPMEDTRLLQETFCFLNEPYTLPSLMADWKPLLPILSDSLPTFSSLSDQIFLLQASGLQGDIAPSFTFSDTPSNLTPTAPSPEEGETPPGSLPIKNITIAPQDTEGYLTADNIYINNQTSYDIDINEHLNSPLPFKYENGKVQVLIIHTHGTESFTPEGKVYYTDEDTNRSFSEEENILKIGKEITKRLTAAGIGTIHNTTIHDYPSFSGSYANAEKTIVSELKANPSICIVLDIHRDAMIASDGVKYRPITHYNGLDYAQVMLVMGTDEGGLTHKNWQSNLSFALKVQKSLNDLIPALARPLYLKKQRFNQHVTPGSMLIEVGASGNYQSDALHTVDPLCEVLIDIIKGTS